MKRIVLLAALITSTGLAVAAPISASLAGKFVGRNVTVEGKISDVHFSKSGVTFIDIGGKYPRYRFTALIPLQSAAHFENVQGYEGRLVEITGMVEMYRGKPEIVLTAPDQIQVIDDAKIHKIM